MNKRFYKVMLHGEGLVLFSSDGSFSAGFYATRNVRAGDENEAKERAIAIVAGELRERVDSEYRNELRIEIEEIREINWLKYAVARNGGFSFYEL